MLVSEVARLSPTERFLYWMRERHNIYLKKEARQPKPWTDDEILQRYFFTNPYRENDKVTRWFRERVRDPLRNSPEVIFATICFRWFNWIPTGKFLMGIHDRGKPNYFGLLTDWDTKSAVDYLTIHAQRNKVFTGAFMISNTGSNKPKIRHVCEHFIQPIWNDRETLIEDFSEPNLTMRQAHNILQHYPGMGGGGFMAYEVVCDLRYTKWLEHARDKCTWSNPGPGAKRGMNRLLGLDPRAPLKDYQEQSRKLLTTARLALPDMPMMEMREIEHSLCEWDKYERARLGDGKMKRRYAGL